MANPVCDILLTEAELRVPDYPEDVSAGGVVDFSGRVRALERGHEIEGLEYEANWPMAEHQLRVIAQEAQAKFGLSLVVIQHRLGFVRSGEPSLFLRVAASHRAEAFAASEWIVDELKKRVPIWKKPRFVGENSEIGDSAKLEAEKVS